MEWFYANGGNRVGPVTPVAFEGLLKDNVIRADTLVWSQGQTEWRPWSHISAETAACAVSGGRYWRRDMVPYEGKFISAAHKEDFFQRLKEGVHQPHEMRYAGFWYRFLAKFIDGLILWVVNTATSMVMALVFFGAFSFAPRSPDIGRVFLFQGVTMLINIGIALLYSWFFISRYSATPGKMALGLKVLRADGAALTTGRIIGRYFAEWLSSLILAIGYIMAAFDDQKRALHDRICDTRVIRSR